MQRCSLQRGPPISTPQRSMASICLARGNKKAWNLAALTGSRAASLQPPPNLSAIFLLIYSRNPGRTYSASVPGEAPAEHRPRCNAWCHHLVGHNQGRRRPRQSDVGAGGAEPLL
eukprot:scaffold7047_cov65-Phaeocystis_antarctica.AAC.2